MALKETGNVSVGEAIPIWVGDIDDAWSAIADEAGAAPRGSVRMSPTIAKHFATINQRLAQLSSAASSNPKLRVFAPLANSLSKAAASFQTASMASAAARRVKDTADKAETATHIIPVCFDGISATTASGTATIKAPHSGQPWRVLGMHVPSAQCGVNPPRVTNYSFAGVERVITANVTFDSGAPTTPGQDISIWSNQSFLAGSSPRFRYNPWGVRTGLLRSDAQVTIKLYNPHSAAQSLNLSIFVQSNPCGEDELYTIGKAVNGVGGVYGMDDPMIKTFFGRLRAGSWR